MQVSLHSNRAGPQTVRHPVSLYSPRPGSRPQQRTGCPFGFGLISFLIGPVVFAEMKKTKGVRGGRGAKPSDRC